MPTEAAIRKAYNKNGERKLENNETKIRREEKQ
jgi:hypothetical protein